MIHRGGCLCGAIRYETEADLRASIGCHCTQCRKTSGHYWSATQVPTESLRITGDTLAWYRSSPEAQRGFCTRCGASLFWRMDGAPGTSIGSGTLDAPTGIRETAHIFVAAKGDYYDLPPGVDCAAGYP